MKNIDKLLEMDCLKTGEFFIKSCISVQKSDFILHGNSALGALYFHSPMESIISLSLHHTEECSSQGSTNRQTPSPRAP